MQDLIVILTCSAAALGCTALVVGFFIVIPQTHAYAKTKQHVRTKNQKTSDLTPA